MNELVIRVKAEGNQQVQQALAQIQKNLQAVGATVKVVSQSASSSLSSWSQRLNSIAERMEKVSKGIEKFGDSARRLGTIMTATVGGSVALATKTFADFETRLAEIQTIAKVSQSQLEQMGRQIRQIAIESGQNFETTARALYQILSAGVSVEKSMNVLQASAKLAAAGLADLESTADALTTVLNSYRMSAEKAARVADVMFKTVELGKTTVPELAQQIGRVASTAAQAGVSFEELSAAIAAMTAAGVRTEIAISSLGQLLQNLLNPNKALSETLQQLGYSSGLALLQAKGLAGALDLLSKSIPREQLAEMIGSVEGLRAVMVLTGSQGDRFVEMMEKIKNSTGATEQAFKTISETASFKFHQALLSVQNALIELGAAFTPALEKIAEAIRNTLDNLQRSGQMKQMQQDLRQLADDFGKALAGAIEKAAATMEKFNKLAPETRQKIMELAITLGPLTLAVGTVAGALAKIIDLVAKLGKGFAWLIEKVPQAAAAIAAFVSKIPPWLRTGGALLTMITTGGAVLAQEAKKTLSWLQGVAEERKREEELKKFLFGRSHKELYAFTREELHHQLEKLQRDPAFRKFFESGMQDFAIAGRKIGENIAKGIEQSKGQVGKAMDKVAEEGRKRLPKSPPEVGPLKDIVQAGMKIPELIAEGIRKDGLKAVKAMEKLAEYLTETWSRFLRRFELLGEIKLARARAAGKTESEILQVESQVVSEELAATSRVLGRMKESKRKGVPVSEEEILEIELRVARLQERLAEIAERRRELEEREREKAKLERERERQELMEFYEQVKREAQDKLQTEIFSVEKKIEELQKQRELVAGEEERVRIAFELADAYEYLASLLNQQAKFAETLYQRTQLAFQIAEALQRAKEIRPQISLPMPESYAQLFSPITPALPERNLEVTERPQIAMLADSMGFAIPKEVEWETTLIRARAIMDVARSQLEIMKMQGLTRQQLRIAEIETLKTIKEQLEIQKEILRQQLMQLKTELEQLRVKKDLTEQDLKRSEQLSKDIAQMEAELMRLESQIQMTAAEIARNNPFGQFREGLEDAFERFEEAIADALAGVRDLGDAFKNLWQDVKRQFWRLIVQEMLSPFLNWLRSWARQIGEIIFGSIFKQPVLTFGLLPSSKSLPIPSLPLPSLPQFAGVGAAMIASQAGANKELSALAGAAVGFAVGGPVGAIIGGLAGLLGGKKKKKKPEISAIPLGVSVVSPSVNINTTVTLQVDGREMGRVMVRQMV